MNTESPPSRSKITLRVWTPIYRELVDRTDKALIRRDQLIARTLALELPRIREELPHPNSDRAYQFLEQGRKAVFAGKYGSTQMSLALTPSVAQALEDVCREKNIPRENLLNRLLMLLGASGDYVNENFWITSSKWRDRTPEEAGTEWDARHLASSFAAKEFYAESFDNAFSPLGRMETVLEDPLGRYRALLGELYDGCHGGSTPQMQEQLVRTRYEFTPFGMISEKNDDLFALSCYLADESLELEEGYALMAPKRGK